MKILAIDSTGTVASTAVMADGVLTSCVTSDGEKKHSITLMPMIESAMKTAGLKMKDIDAIATACGPGSFTGLRIGCALAKGLAIPGNTPIIPVPTLEALACNITGAGSDTLICPIMDARRQQVYNGIYINDKELVTIRDQRALPIAEVVEDIEKIFAKNSELKRVIFLGDGCRVYMSYIEENLKVPFETAPPQAMTQRASSVAALGELKYNEGKYVSPGDFSPVYIRKSQAEREREEKERS